MFTITYSKVNKFYNINYTNPSKFIIIFLYLYNNLPFDYTFLHHSYKYYLYPVTSYTGTNIEPDIL